MFIVVALLFLVVLLSITALMLYGTYYIFRVYTVPKLVAEGKFFGLPLSRAIRYRYKADKFVEYLYDPNEYAIDAATGDITELNLKPGTQPESLCMRLFGAEWIGLPPYNVHQWSQGWSRPRKTDDAEIEGSVVLATKSVTHRSEIVDALYVNLALADVFPTELEDQSTVNITINWNAKFKNARIPVNDLKGNWYLNMYANINNILEQFARDYNNTNWKSGRGVGIGQTLVLLKEEFEKPDFKQRMFRITGADTTDFLFESSDPVSKAVADANQERAIKEAKARGDVAEAEGYAKQLNIRTGADAARIKDLGKARGDAIRDELAGASNPATLVGIRQAEALGQLVGLRSLVQTSGQAPGIILDNRDGDGGNSNPTQPTPQANPPINKQNPKQTNQNRPNKP